MNSEIREQMKDESVELLLDILEEVRNESDIITKFEVGREIEPFYRNGHFEPAKVIEKSQSRSIKIEKPSATIEIEITER